MAILLNAGLLNAGLLDAGLLDAGLLDAGLLDAGLRGAGLSEAGAVRSVHRVAQGGVKRDMLAWPVMKALPQMPHA